MHQYKLTMQMCEELAVEAMADEGLADSVTALLTSAQSPYRDDVFSTQLRAGVLATFCQSSGWNVAIRSLVITAADLYLADDQLWRRRLYLGEPIPRLALFCDMSIDSDRPFQLSQSLVQVANEGSVARWAIADRIAKQVAWFSFGGLTYDTTSRMDSA